MKKTMLALRKTPGGEEYYFVDSGCSSADPSASLVAESTGIKAASSSIHSKLAPPDENNARKLNPLKFNSH